MKSVSCLRFPASFLPPSYPTSPATRLCLCMVRARERESFNGEREKELLVCFEGVVCLRVCVWFWKIAVRVCCFSFSELSLSLVGGMLLNDRKLHLKGNRRTRQVSHRFFYSAGFFYKIFIVRIVIWSNMEK